MPFYEYQCANCGHELEAMQKISDVPLKRCPDCGKSKLQRLVSAPVFRLKGGGWYETDFKNDKDKKRNLADHAGDAPKEEVKGTEAAKTEPAKPDSKTESKPAEKPAADSKPAKKKAHLASGRRARKPAKTAGRR
jgi:putative FmdB family regulatory protein